MDIIMGRHTYYPTPDPQPEKQHGRSDSTDDSAQRPPEVASVQGSSTQAAPSTTQKEVDHGYPPLNQTQDTTFALQAEAVSGQKLLRQQWQAEQLRLMELYKLNPGKCPRCGVICGRGIYGHLSKCLPLATFQPGSQATT